MSCFAAMADLTLAEVAKRFERDAATMSTALRRLEDKMKMSDEFYGHVHCIKDAIIKL